MDHVESIKLLTIIAMLKRSTSSRDVLTVCDALEKFLLVKPAPVSAPEQGRSRFDKGKYMKAYMAKRRAEARRPKA